MLVAMTCCYLTFSRDFRMAVAIQSTELPQPLIRLADDSNCQCQGCKIPSFAIAFTSLCCLKFHPLNISIGTQPSMLIVKDT